VTPSEIQDAIVAALTVRYTAFKVEAHGGNFTERELPFLLSKAPVILVACTTLPGLQPAGVNKWRSALRWGLFVLGSDTATEARDDVALDTAFDLLLWVPGQRWGLEEARLPDMNSLNASNLYTGSTNNLRVALWGLRWDQTFTFTVT